MSDVGWLNEEPLKRPKQGVTTKRFGENPAESRKKERAKILATYRSLRHEGTSQKRRERINKQTSTKKGRGEEKRGTNDFEARTKYRGNGIGGKDDILGATAEIKHENGISRNRPE